MRKWIAVMSAVLAVAVAGLWWLGRAPVVPRAVLEKQYATAPSQFLTLADGARVHIRDRGRRDAPAVILLHGFAGSLFVWEKWSLALVQHYRVVTIDLPGNGLTGPVPSGDYSQAALAATVGAVADQLGLKRFALAGNSLGGAVAARLAETMPDRVTAVVLIDAAGVRTETRPRLHLIYYAAHVPLVSRLMLRRVVDGHYPFRAMDGMDEAMTAHFRLKDDPFVWDHVGAIKAPVLILWGANDRLIPLAAAHAWQKAIPGSHLIVYPGAGHVAMLDAPEASLADARSFLDAHVAAQK